MEEAFRSFTSDLSYTSETYVIDMKKLIWLSAEWENKASKRREEERRGVD